MLSGLFVNGVAFPLLFGIVIALVLTIVADSRTTFGCLLAGLAVVAAYVALENVPPFPPGAVKQKLAYVFLASAILVPVATLRSRWRRWVLVGLTGGFALACLFWFAGPITGRATSLDVVLAPIGYTVLASLAACALLFASASTDAPVSQRPLVRLSAILAYCIGSAVVAAIGGFIGMGQMFGALAALTGGIVLVGYLAVLRGNTTLPARLDGVVPAVLLPALATGIVVAFFATSLDAVAYMLLPLTLIVGTVLTGSTRLDRLPRAIGPIAQGAIAALPVLTSITVAVLR